MTSEQLLKDHQLRITPFRLKILDLFMSQSHAAITSQDIEKSLSGVDRITLYRTLKSFETKGLIHQVMDGTATTKYALCHKDCAIHQHNEEHAHFLCNACGNTYCLDAVPQVNLQLPKDYKLDKVQLALTGTCAQCH